MRRKEITGFIRENKNFNLLWASQGLSQITLNMINFVMATRIYEKTGSTLAVSFLWVFYYLPAFFLGPFSGYLVDLWSYRKTLLYTNGLQTLTMLLFLLVGDRVYPIYPIVFLYSLLNQFYYPAESSCIPWLVRKKDFPFANSLFLLTAQSALVFGFGVSGILIRLFGPNNPIYISAFSLFLATVAVFFLPENQPHRQRLSGSIYKFINEIKTGYLYLRDTKIVLFPLILMILFQVFLVILGVMIPGFSKEILQIEIHDAGPFLVVPLGLGTLSGAILMTKVFYHYRKRTLMKRGFLISFIILTIFVFLLPLAGRYKTAFASSLMLFLGLAGFLIAIPNQTLVQEHTPARLRGRVYGSLGFLGNLVTLPCLLFMAMIVDFIGVQTFMFLLSLTILTMLVMFDRVERYILSREKLVAALPSAK